jgi:hypothetical protein
LIGEIFEATAYSLIDKNALRIDNKKWPIINIQEVPAATQHNMNNHGKTKLPNKCCSTVPLNCVYPV